jgi:hypothetical protein
MAIPIFIDEVFSDCLPKTHNKNLRFAPHEGARGGSPLRCELRRHQERVRRGRGWRRLGLRSILKIITRRNSDSMKAGKTTYSVPRNLIKVRIFAKITHIMKMCTAKRVDHKSQKRNDAHLSREKLMRAPKAQAVHMIAACHFCGCSFVSRMNAAIRPTAATIQPTTVSLKAIFFFDLSVPTEPPGGNRPRLKSNGDEASRAWF